jgi:hypothetical protein
MWINLITAKSDTMSAIKKVKATTKLEVRQPLRVLQSMAASSRLTSLSPTVLMKVYNVSSPLLIHRSRIESLEPDRAHHGLRTTEGESDAVQYWGQAVTTAVFLRNRGPTLAMDDKTLFEAYHGQKSTVSFLRTFGCLSFTKDKRPRLKKLDDRSVPMDIIG